jgi:hypothetical protein
MTTHTWKLPHVLKGTLTWVPPLNQLRLRTASTGGTDSPRYCYAVWLRHLVMLSSRGFSVRGAHVGELGPGDSIGVGLAALLSGAESYVGLDVFPFSAKSDPNVILDDLVGMFSRREPIPDVEEFPAVRPRLPTYKFPEHAIAWEGFDDRVERVRGDLRNGLDAGRCVRYRAPWSSRDAVERSSLDLLFSQAVLQYATPLRGTYEAMSAWLKPGGLGSHTISFDAHGLSPFWNGHWAYSDRAWWLARGRREIFLNREPLGVHRALAREFGLEISYLKRERGGGGLPVGALASRFRALDAEDLETRGVFLILRRGA